MRKLNALPLKWHKRVRRLAVPWPPAALCPLLLSAPVTRKRNIPDNGRAYAADGPRRAANKV